MKYKLPKGSVQETLLIPLYGRKMAMELYPDLFADRDCQELLSKIEFGHDEIMTHPELIAKEIHCFLDELKNNFAWEEIICRYL